MKLRLPHKFQAALVAAIASVSFTTISSGTLAVATGAALFTGQQVQAEVLQASEKLATNKALSGVTGTAITLSGMSYANSSGNTNQFTIAGGAVFSPNVKVNGADGWWTLTFTLTNTTGYDITLNSLLLDMTMFNSSGGNQNPPTYRSTQLTLTTGQTQLDNQNIVLSSVANSNQNASYLYDLSTSSVTTEKPVLTMGDGGITLEKGTSQTFTLKDSRSTIREGATNIDNGCFFGLKDMVVNYSYEVAGFPTWNGTDGHANWSDATAWTNGIPTAATPAVFNADATVRTVNVDTTGAAATVTVDGAAYTFEGSGSVTAQSLAFTGDGAGLTLGTNMTLSAQSDYAALANVTVAQGGTLAVAAGTKSVINLNAASAGTLEIKSGSVSNTSVIGTAAATLKLDNGTSLYFDNNANHTFNHNLELGGDATIEVYGSTYHPNGVTITGNVSGAGHKLTKQDGGQLTINGQVNLGTLNINSASTVIINSSEGAKSTIDDVDSVTGSTLRITNADVNLRGNNSQGFKSSLEIGQGATVRVKDTDSMKWSDYTNTITLLKGGTLDFEQKRLSIGSGTTIVMAGGTIQGTGDGTAAMDYHQDGATIRATANSTISATIQLRNGNHTTNFNVENGTALTVSGTVKGSGNLHKLGAGELALSGTLSYTGTTAVDAGVLTVSSAYSLNSANQLQVNGGTANFNGAVTIGNAGTFSVADGATLTFGGTVAVTRNTVDTRKYGPSRETGNGFGYTYTYASVGAGAGGNATWTLNSHAAEYNAATGEVGWTADDGGTYYIYTPEAISAVMAKNPTAVTVDTLGATQELGNGSYSLTRLQIDSGVVTTNRSGASDGIINKGEIVINAGGTFKIIGNNDALGYGGNCVTTVTLNGEEGKLATLDLAMTQGSETMKSNLVLNGHARITDSGSQHKGFNTYGGSITATGTDNVIEHMQLRQGVTVTVNSGADLVVNTLDNAAQDETRNFTKKGTGTLTIGANTASIATLTLNAGELVIESGTSHIGTIKGTQVDNNNKWNHTLVIGAEPTGSQDAPHATVYATRVEMGNINDGQKTMVSNLVVNEGSTLAITGNSTATDYSNASFVLGEWSVSTTADIKGTVIAENDFLVGGDSGYVMNIDGGTVLVKGLKRDGNKNPNHRINVSNGGKLILGETGITTTNAGNAGTLTLDNGTIGVYADNVSIEKNIALSGAVTFDTQKYTVSDTTVSRGTAAGNLSISGNLTGNATITKDGAGTLTLTGANTITHTIDLKAGTLAMNGGSVTVDAANLANFVQFGETDPTYTHGDSGFLASSALYYLVKGASGTTATKVDGFTLTGGTWATDEEAAAKTAGDLVFKFNTSETPGGIYYVNSNMSTADDGGAPASDASTGFAIKEGVVLTAANSNAYGTAKVLHGAGTYALASNATALNGKLTIGDDWTGAVRLSGTANGWDISTIGNNIASTIEFAGVTGYFVDPSTGTKTLSRDVIFTNAGTNNAAVYFNNGFSRDGAYEFAGSVSGSGTFQFAGGPTYHLVFSGDVSEWSGELKVTNCGNANGGSWVKFTGDAHEVNATINKTGGTFHVIADTDTTFNKAITADKLEVTAGHTATLSAAATVGGLTGAGNVVTPMLPPSDAPKVTITLNGTGTGANAYTFGGSLTAHYLNKTGSGTQTFNGDVTLNRLAIGSGTTYFNGAVSVNSQGYSAQGDQVINLSGGSTTYFNGPVTYTNGNNYAILLSGANTTAHFGGTTDLGNKHIGNQANTLVVVDTGASLTLNQFANSSTLGSNGAVTVQSGAYVRTNGAFRTPTLVNNGEIDARNILHVGTMEGSGTITVANTLTVESQSNSSYSGNITAADLTKKNTGKLTLSGVNAFTNATTLSAGTLEVAQVGSLGGQGVTTGANTSLIFNTADDGIYGGSITGTGSVTKSGEGNLVLTGANSYTGATAVNGGSLILLGRSTLGGNITVAENATLKLAASSSPVTGGSLTLAENSHLEISGINGTRARSGSSFTVASATGGITLNGVAPTLSGAYSGNVALSSDGKSLVVSDVTQTGNIYHLYILTGQSNSMGTSKDVPLPQGMLDAYSTEGGTLWNGNMVKGGNRYVADPAWQDVEPQLPEISRNGKSSLCMGPEYGFTYMMLEKGWFTTEEFASYDGLGVMKASLDGGGNGYWVKGGSPSNYNVILDSMQRAILQASKAGYSAVSVDGLMYLQGESDSASETNVADTRFAAFLGNMTADLAAWQKEQGLDVQLIFSNNAVTGENFSNATTSQKFLDAATSNGLVNADQNGRGHVFTKDLAGIGDDLHYTGNSQLTIGARYAYAFAVQNGIDVGAVRGQDDSKNLNEAGAWWMEVLPGEDQVATWDISSVSTANNIADGQTLTVGGIEIGEVYHEGATAKGQGSIAINGGNLSLGTGGIELTGADLTIGSAVDVRESQTWKTGDHTLTTGGTVAIAEGKLLTIDEGASFNFTDFSGAGSLAIGSGATVGMSSAAFDSKEHHVGYSDGDNGYMEGYVVLSTLTGENSDISLGDNLTGADALTGGTFSKKAVEGGTGVSLLVNMGGETSTVYYVRKGTVTYDAGEKFGKATELLLNTAAGEQSPAVLNLSSSLQGGLTVLSEGTGGTISIGSGVELAESSLQTVSAGVTLTGSGTFVMNAKTGDVTWPLPTGVSLAQGETGWTGIVRISGGNFKSSDLDALANGLYSTIELNGVSGWTSHSNGTLALNLMLTDKEDGTAAWDFNAGNSTGDYDNPKMTITGKVSGTGTLKKTNNNHESFAFAGDISGWTGAYELTVGKKSRLTFLGNAHEVNIDTRKTNANGQISIAVGDGTAAFSTKFTEQSDMQGVNEILVRANATAEFAGSIASSGTSTFNGNVTNSGTMTLNGLTMATGATFTNTGSLTLNGTITFGAAGIVNSGDGAITLSSGNTFNLANMQADDHGVYRLFTSEDDAALVDLSQYHYSAANVTGGGDMTGKVWIFGTDGTLTAYTPTELVWAGTDDDNTWTTSSSVTNWTAADTAVAFHQGDKVTFAGGETATTAILGENVTTDRMTVNAGATMTVKNGESTHYTLEVNELVVNGTLTTDAYSTVKNVTIAQGGVWNTSGSLELTGSATYTNEGKLNLLAGATMTATTAQALGTVSAEQGATLTVSGTGTYTLAGAADDPFSGRLVYNIDNTSDHNNGISLSNFDGVLEIRGRVDANSFSIADASKVVFNGDRSSNNTGIWDHGANMTLAKALEVIGDNKVEIYANATTTIGSTVNGGTEKQGHLSKVKGGTLNFNGAVALADFTTPEGTVNFNDSASLDATYINGGTVNLNGGAEKDYNLGVVNAGSGILAIGDQGVKSLGITDYIVRGSHTLKSNTADPLQVDIQRLDLSNFGTNMTLENVTLNVSGAATAAVLNTAQVNDQATVTVGDKATLNLNGGVVWNKADGAKTDYVNLTINNGGTANITAGTENVLNAVTVNAGGKLTFSQDTATTVKGALTLNDTLTNNGSLTLGSATVAANQTGTIAGNGTVTLNGTIGGAGTFKLDDATLTGGTNAAISGNMVIDGGTLAGTMSIGTNSANTIRVTDVFTVQDGAEVTINGTMVLDDLADVTVIYTDAERDVEKNGFITGVSARVFNITPGSDGVIFAGGQPTYKGVAGIISDGMFYKSSTDYTTFFVNVATETAETYSHALAMANAGRGDFTKVELAAGTSFDIDQNAILNTVTVTGGSASLIGSSTLSLGTDVAAASLLGAGDLAINGPTVTINGTNRDYTGDIDVLSGTLKLGSSSDHARFVLGALNIAGQTPDRTITIGTGATLDINDKADANYIYTLQGGRLTNSGNGLGNNSSQTMGLIVNADSYVGQTGQNGEFWLRKSNAYSATPILTLNANLTKQGGSTFGLHNTTVTGTGAIVVQEGTLSVTDGGTFAANLQLAGGTVSGTLNLAGSSVITTTAASTFSAAISTNGHGVTFNGDLNLAATGALTGNGGVTKNGTGTLELTTVNNYGGTFTVNAGKLLITTDALPGTLRASGDGELDLRVSQNGTNVELKTVNAANLHLVADADHNSRFNYTSNSNLTGVEDLYFDGGQLWLNGKDMTGDSKFTGNVTFNTATVYSESGNIFDRAAMRIGQNAEFAGTVDVNVDTKLGWGNAKDKTLEISRELVGSGNLVLESYTDSTSGTLKISGDASNYQGATTSNSHITVHVTESGKMNLATGSNLAGTVQLDASGKMTVSGDSTISGAINGTGSLEVKKDATLNYNRSAETTVAAQLSGEGTLQYTGTGTTKFTGDVSNFTGSVDVEAGTLNIMNIAQAASLNVKDVTIAANATMGVYNGTNATPGTTNEGTLTIQDTQTLKATGAGATLNANLVMAEGSNLDVSGTGGAGLLMGSDVTLNPGNKLTVNGSADVDSYLRGYFDGSTTKLYTLFEGTERDPLQLYIGNQKIENDITFESWDKPFMDASTIYTNLQAQTYYLVYDHTSSNVGMVAIGFAPEPTTGTLSLLALCALAARRRRKA